MIYFEEKYSSFFAYAKSLSKDPKHFAVLDSIERSLSGYAGYEKLPDNLEGFSTYRVLSPLGSIEISYPLYLEGIDEECYLFDLNGSVKAVKSSAVDPDKDVAMQLYFLDGIDYEM